MELKQIKELMSAMGRTGTKRLTLKKDDFELVLEREAVPERFFDSSIDGREDLERHSQAWQRVDQALSKASDNSGNRFPAPPLHEIVKDDSASLFVTSPMVGTFYPSPSPDDPPFVRIGDRVDKNDQVCIIEAMKVMNEIKANISGVIVEVLVEAGQPVEFGTKLFRMTE
ncbi:MAG: acetyl-CoA carboxylase biotin carboxyl carrier protein [Parachlamydiaceae bacterium]|nr:acetyl-CoA carboxylase biotin carboxyl carrier protein [Parachlamydiaceae bacterium]